MDREVERLAAVLQHHTEDPLDRIGAGKVVDAAADGVDRGFRQDSFDRALEDVGTVAAEIIGDVLRGHADREVRLRRDHEAERLDAAGNVNRLAVAIGEVDLLHDSAAACANRSKARRAGPTRSSSVQQFAGMALQNGEVLRPERMACAVAKECRVAGHRRIAALPYRPEQIGRAEARSFQHIQGAEHGEAVGQVGRVKPARHAAKPGEVGQQRAGAGTIVPIGQQFANAGRQQRLLQRQYGRGVDLQEAAIAGHRAEVQRAKSGVEPRMIGGGGVPQDAPEGGSLADGATAGNAAAINNLRRRNCDFRHPKSFLRGVGGRQARE